MAKFNGKVYELYRFYKQKRDAAFDAVGFRNNGWYVRVVKGSGGYTLYRRNMSKRVHEMVYKHDRARLKRENRTGKAYARKRK